MGHNKLLKILCVIFFTSAALAAEKDFREVKSDFNFYSEFRNSTFDSADQNVTLYFDRPRIQDFSGGQSFEQIESMVGRYNPTHDRLGDYINYAQANYYEATGHRIPREFLAMNAALQAVMNVSNGSEALRVLREARSHLNSETKALFLVEMGRRFLLNYDYSRASRSERPVVSFDEMLRGLQKGIPTGVSGDAGCALAKMAHNMGLRGFCLGTRTVGEALSSGHGSFLGVDPNDPSQIIKINWDDLDITNLDGTRDINSGLTLRGDLPSSGLKIKIADHTGKVVHTSFTELGTFMAAIDGTLEQLDPLLFDNNIYGKLGLKKGIISAEAFKGQTPSGGEVHGGGVRILYGKKNESHVYANAYYAEHKRDGKYLDNYSSQNLYVSLGGRLYIPKVEYEHKSTGKRLRLRAFVSLNTWNLYSTQKMTLNLPQGKFDSDGTSFEHFMNADVGARLDFTNKNWEIEAELKAVGTVTEKNLGAGGMENKTADIQRVVLALQGRRFIHPSKKVAVFGRGTLVKRMNNLGAQTRVEAGLQISTPNQFDWEAGLQFQGGLDDEELYFIPGERKELGLFLRGDHERFSVDLSTRCGTNLKNCGAYSQTHIKLKPNWDRKLLGFFGIGSGR